MARLFQSEAFPDREKRRPRVNDICAYFLKLVAASGIRTM